MSRPPRRPPPPRHTVAVEIAGEKHVLRSDVPPEYTRSVAAHVDATIRALPGFQTLEPFRAATLAALSITDELFRAREEIRRLREEAEYRTNVLADRLEAASAAAAEKRPVRRPSAVPPTVSWSADPPAAAPDSADVPPLPGDTERPPVEVELQPVPASLPGNGEPASTTPPPLPGDGRQTARSTGDGPLSATPAASPPVTPPPLLGDQPAWSEDADAPAHHRGTEADHELELPPPE